MTHRNYKHKKTVEDQGGSDLVRVEHVWRPWYSRGEGPRYMFAYMVIPADKHHGQRAALAYHLRNLRRHMPRIMSAHHGAAV